MRRIAAGISGRLFPTFLVLATLTLFSVHLVAGPRTGLIVKLKPGSDAARLVGRHGLTVKKSVTRGSSSLLVINTANAKSLRSTLIMDAEVEYAEEDVAFPLDGGETVLPMDGGETVLPMGPANPATSDQTIWELLDGGETVLPMEEREIIKAAYAALAKMVTPSERLLVQPAFRKIGLYPSVSRATGRGVIIADLDTGADTCHPALRGVVTWSFVDETNTPENCPTSATAKVPGYGHGTAVGSLIRSVAPEATLWSLRVFDSSGTALISDIYDATVFAVDRGAKVINMSFGTTTKSETLQDAVQYARERGVTVVASAGNSNLEPLMYPARYSEVKGITATNSEDLKATFSNFGGEAFAAAPGVKMWVAYPNYQLTMVSGTSYSSPLAAAEAALVIDALQRQYSWHSYDNVHYAMRRGTIDINRLNPLYYNKLGKGRIYIPWALDWTAFSTGSTTN